MIRNRFVTAASEGTGQERRAEDFFPTQAQEDSQGGQSTEENTAVAHQQAQPFDQQQQSGQEEQPNVAMSADQQFNLNANANLLQQSSQQMLLQQHQQQQQQLQYQQQQQLQQQLQQQQHQQYSANAEQVPVAASDMHQMMTPAAVSTTLQTSYTFNANTNAQSSAQRYGIYYTCVIYISVFNSTSDASYGQPQVSHQILM